jgi:hypothetical protein
MQGVPANSRTARQSWPRRLPLPGAGATGRRERVLEGESGGGVCGGVPRCRITRFRTLVVPISHAGGQRRWHIPQTVGCAISRTKGDFVLALFGSEMVCAITGGYAS